MRSKITIDLRGIVNAVRKNSDVPCAIGFGISTPEQAEIMAEFADGVIVGSAIIKILEKHGKNASNFVGKYVKSMKYSLR